MDVGLWIRPVDPAERSEILGRLQEQEASGVQTKEEAYSLLLIFYNISHRITLSFP
jgi:hypothetical protein